MAEYWRPPAQKELFFNFHDIHQKKKSVIIFQEKKDEIKKNVVWYFYNVMFLAHQLFLVQEVYRKQNEIDFSIQ